MAKVIRVTGASTIDFLKDQLVPGEDFSDKEGLAEALKELLRGETERCFFLISDAKLDQDQVTDYLLAYVHPNASHIVLHQVLGQDLEILRKMFLRLVLWSEQTGIPHIRASIERSDEALLGKLGMLPIVQNYYLNTTEKVDSLLKEAPDATDVKSAS